jgi:2-phospho-L-lactate transferase/gluconeogenesis factor (CofD/UPF0052 family)
MDKKSLINEYKQKEPVGGIYRITNTRNGRYLLDCSPNIQSMKNRFDFSISSGSCFNYKLKNDWSSFGGAAFAYETLETLEKKKDQSHEKFTEDLKMLLQVWSDKLDSPNRY